MAKTIDITEKLNFEESPVLLIQGHEIHVNDDAVTMLSGHAADGYRRAFCKGDYEGV